MRNKIALIVEVVEPLAGKKRAVHPVAAAWESACDQQCVCLLSMPDLQRSFVLQLTDGSDLRLPRLRPAPAQVAIANRQLVIFQERPTSHSVVSAMLADDQRHTVLNLPGSPSLEDVVVDMRVAGPDHSRSLRPLQALGLLDQLGVSF